MRGNSFRSGWVAGSWRADRSSGKALLGCAEGPLGILGGVGQVASDDNERELDSWTGLSLSSSLSVPSVANFNLLGGLWKKDDSDVCFDIF